MKRYHALRILAAMALVLVIAAGTMPGTRDAAYAASPVTITVQPQDVTVTCPEGAEFHVEVDHPENVASYQWELSDGRDRKSTRLNSSHPTTSRMPSSA